MKARAPFTPLRTTASHSHSLLSASAAKLTYRWPPSAMNDTPARTRMPSGTKRWTASGRGVSSGMPYCGVGRGGDASPSPYAARSRPREHRSSSPTLGAERGEVGDSRALAETHLTLPSLRDGPLPLPPKGRRGQFVALFVLLLVAA